MRKSGEQKSSLEACGAAEPSRGFLDAIMLHITDEEAHRFHRRIALFAGLVMIAAFSFVPAWHEFQNELSSSGFSTFLSLLTSDTASLLTYWKEFSISLLEAIPVFGLTAVLGTLFILLSSLRFLILNISGGVRYARTAKHHG